MSPTIVEHDIDRDAVRSAMRGADDSAEMHSALAAPAGLGAPAAQRSEPAASEYERRLDIAYTEYMARLAAGEDVDEEAFCRRHAGVRSSLARLISAHRFLEANPRLLVDDEPRTDDKPHAPPPQWPAAGELFEGFELSRELGRGAFSRVFLARQPALGGRLVAVKVTPHANYEAAALGRVEHPNIVPIHSVHQAPGRGQSVVCMPYRGRVTLHEVIDALPADGPLPRAATILDACRDKAFPAMTGPRWLRAAPYCDAVRWLAAQLADALAYLHERGTSHRDLKPSNVLLQADATPLLLDFNLSDNRETPNVRLGGTPAYMAPEQIRAMKDRRVGALDGKADVFALGVILYEWLAGTFPFGPVSASLADEALRDLIARQRRGPVPLAQQRPNVDAALARLIEQCLAFDPDQRPSARELTKALRGQLQPHRRLARAAGRRPRLAAAALALLLATACAAAVYGVSRPPAHERAYQDGVAAFLTGRFEEAEEHFNRAVLDKPDEAKYRYARARTWQQLAEDKREYAGMASAEYHAAQKLHPDARHAAGSGYCLHRLDNQTLARFFYDKALSEGYGSPGLLNNLACCWLAQGNPIQAEKHLRRALELDPTVVQAHWNMAMTQKHVWAPLITKTTRERSADPRFREAIAVAKHHIGRAVELSGASSPEMLADAAHIHALAASVDSADVEVALRMAERAVDRGTTPGKLMEDQFLKRAIQRHPDFAIFVGRAPGAAAAKKLSRLVDPLSGL